MMAAVSLTYTTADIGTIVNMLASPGSVPDRTRRFEIVGFRDNREASKSRIEYRVRRVAEFDVKHSYWVPAFDVTPALNEPKSVPDLLAALQASVDRAIAARVARVESIPAKPPVDHLARVQQIASTFANDDDE